MRCSISRRQQIQHRHTHRNPIFHLLQDDVMGTVCCIGGNFDAAVDGAWVHHHNFFVQLVEHLFGDAKILVVFAEAGEKFDVLTLQLDAEYVGHIAPAQSVAHIVADFYAQFAIMFGNQGWRTTNPHFCAEFQETKNIAEGYAAVQNVANDGNFFACYFAESFPDGKCVEQGLGRVFVGAVAGVDNIGRYSA